MFNVLKHKYNGINWNTDFIESVEKEVLKFCLTTSRKWSKVSRNYKLFEKINSEWLNFPFKMPIKKKLTSVSVTTTVGRPPKPFINSSERSQRRKINSTISSRITSPEIACAAKKCLYKSGKRSVLQLLKNSTLSPNRAKKINNAYKNINKNRPVPYTADEALAFILDNNLTKQQYINIRLGSKKRMCNIYPSYEKIFIEKKKCYPSNVDIGELCCKIPLQNLLDHTTNRILQIPQIFKINLRTTSLEMLYKWGCDGSSGHSQYKQNFNDNSSLSTDQNIFIFSIVPLELRCLLNDNNTNDGKYDIIWENPTPSSTRFCRPIKFMFKKETAENTREEVKDIETQISELHNSNITYNNRTIQIKHTLIFSMVDGKVHNNILV